MSEAELIISEDKGVRLIKLNRPRTKNAFSKNMYESLTKVLNEDAGNDNIVVTIITGNGDFFSSGNDVVESAQLLAGVSYTSRFQTVENMVNAFVDYPKILIAVVNGPAIGIGSTILPLCDIVYASDTAYFDLPFLRLGLCCEGVSSYFFPRLLGRSKFSEMLFFGHRLTANEALQYRLVSKIIPHAEINQFIEGLKKYGELSVEGVTLNKALVMRDKKKYREINQQEMKELARSVESDAFAMAMTNYLNKKSKL